MDGESIAQRFMNLSLSLFGSWLEMAEIWKEKVRKKVNSQKERWFIHCWAVREDQSMIEYSLSFTVDFMDWVFLAVIHTSRISAISISQRYNSWIHANALWTLSLEMQQWFCMDSSLAPCGHVGRASLSEPMKSRHEGAIRILPEELLGFKNLLSFASHKWRVNRWLAYNRFPNESNRRSSEITHGYASISIAGQ